LVQLRNQKNYERLKMAGRKGEYIMGVFLGFIFEPRNTSHNPFKLGIQIG
jgi:hypothetical protein